MSHSHPSIYVSLNIRSSGCMSSWDLFFILINFKILVDTLFGRFFENLKGIKKHPKLIIYRFKYHTTIFSIFWELVAWYSPNSFFGWCLYRYFTNPRELQIEKGMIYEYNMLWWSYFGHLKALFTRDPSLHIYQLQYFRC